MGIEESIQDNSHIIDKFIKLMDPAMKHENELNEVVAQVYSEFIKLVERANGSKIAVNFVFVKSPLFTMVRDVIKEFNAARAPITKDAEINDRPKRADPNDIKYVCDKLMSKFNGKIVVTCELRNTKSPLQFKASIPINLKYSDATIKVHEYEYAFVFKPAISHEENMRLNAPAPAGELPTF